jgi:hypothetical protein
VHPAVPSPSLSVPASSTQPTSGLLNPILRGYTHIVFLLFSSLPGSSFVQSTICLEETGGAREDVHCLRSGGRFTKVKR